MSIFGNTTNKPLFGGLGSTQTQGSGLFGNQNNQQQNQNAGASTSGIFGGSLFGNQQTQNQNQNQNQNQSTNMFAGGLSGQNNFQQSGFSWNTPQQQQPTQEQVEQARLLNQSSQHLPSFLKSENGGGSRPKDVKDQIQVIYDKWNPNNTSDCAFQYYFYNKVDESIAPFYRPAPDEDEKKWEEALMKKPGPGYIPVRCIGFAQLAARIELQQKGVSTYNNRLHEINSSLDYMISKHELESSIRIMDAKRKHIVLKTRCMVLARKVQVLRNRGYALSNEEDVVRNKLLDLEAKVTDPGLAARGEEIWARMLSVKSRADLLKEQLNRSGVDATNGSGVDEKLMKQANKILEDYTTQLAYLKKEMMTISEEFKAWLDENNIPEVVLPVNDGKEKAKETRANYA